MSGVFAAKQPALFAQHFHHITVAYPGAGKGNAPFSQRMFKSQIGHQGSGNAGHRPMPQTAAYDRQQNLVAIIDLTITAYDHQTIRIAVESQTEVRTLRQNRITQRL